MEEVGRGRKEWSIQNNRYDIYIDIHIPQGKEKRNKPDASSLTSDETAEDEEDEDHGE